MPKTVLYKLKVQNAANWHVWQSIGNWKHSSQTLFFTFVVVESQCHPSGWRKECGVPGVGAQKFRTTLLSKIATITFIDDCIQKSTRGCIGWFFSTKQRREKLPHMQNECEHDTEKRFNRKTDKGVSNSKFSLNYLFGEVVSTKSPNTTRFEPITSKTFPEHRARVWTHRIRNHSGT